MSSRVNLCHYQAKLSEARRGEITVSAAALELATLVLGPHIKVRVVA
jgi:hypothetical protein